MNKHTIILDTNYKHLTGCNVVDVLLFCFIFPDFPRRGWLLTVWCDTLNTFPTAFVRPSRKTILWPGRTYSGCFIKRKWTKALSPVLKHSWDILRIEAVCLMLPQWTEKVEIAKYNKNIGILTFYQFPLPENWRNLRRFIDPPFFLFLKNQKRICSLRIQRGLPPSLIFFYSKLLLVEFQYWQNG